MAREKHEVLKESISRKSRKQGQRGGTKGSIKGRVPKKERTSGKKMTIIERERDLLSRKRTHRSSVSAEHIRSNKKVHHPMSQDRRR